MVDVLATLAPEGGLARRCHVTAPGSAGSPGGPLWTVAVDVGLEEARARMGGGTPGLDLVGACGFGRAETMVRAAGEAVERRALIPVAPDPARIRGVPAGSPGRVSVGIPSVSRAAPVIDEMAADCLPATDLSYGLARTRTALVPAAVVDDPAPEFDPALVDPSPSATAAGPSWSYATERALLESIERDAVLTAWALKPPLTFVDPARPPAGWLGFRAGDVLGRVADALADDADIWARTLLIPSGVTGVSCALSFVFDRHGPTAAGAAASWTMASAVATSAREALQVLVVLRNIGVPERQPAKDEIVDEMSRARHWAHPDSASEPLRWLDSCTETIAAHGEHVTPGRDVERLDHLLRSLQGDGLRPLVCDLTARLPQPVQDLGWVAVRAIVLGHQALPMDERNSWIWAGPRLQQAAERWGRGSSGSQGLAAREAGAHPLI